MKHLTVPVVHVSGAFHVGAHHNVMPTPIMKHDQLMLYRADVYLVLLFRLVVLLCRLTVRGRGRKHTHYHEHANGEHLQLCAHRLKYTPSVAEPVPLDGLQVGSILADTYRIVGLVGRGGMGTVWVAEHARLPGKRVAIKVLHPQVAKDADSVARFRREAEIASRLGHPNIVDVHDFNTLPNGAPYLVLEFLQGEGLDARIARGAIPLDETLVILRQVGSALAIAHAENIVHRDLKPQNIFLTPRDHDGVIEHHTKILDFGISKIRGSQTVQTQDQTILGTPQYMAPEQATGNHAAVDARTDIFALGAIAYEMLSGTPAFAGESVPEVVFKVVYQEPRTLQEVEETLPHEVVAAIHKALSKPQDDRFATIEEFITTLTGSPLITLRSAAAPPKNHIADTVATGETHIAAGTEDTMLPDSAVAGEVEATMPPRSAKHVLNNVGAANAHAPAMTAPSEATPTPKPTTRKWLMVAIAGTLSLVLAGAFVLSRHTQPTDKQPTALHAPVPTTDARAPSSQLASDSGVAAAMPDAAAPASQPTTITKPAAIEHGKRTLRSRTSRTTSGKRNTTKVAPADGKPHYQHRAGEYDDAMKAAQAALGSNMRQVVALTKRALRHKPGDRSALTLLLRAYCSLGDGVRALATARRLRRVPSSIKRTCRKHFIELP